MIDIDATNGILRTPRIGGSSSPLSLGFSDITGAKADSDYTLLAAEYANGILRLAWTGWTGGHNVIAPTVSGAVWDVINTTGQTATVKTAAGTGIAIADTKAARVCCDGTNIVRLTADA